MDLFPLLYVLVTTQRLHFGLEKKRSQNVYLVMGVVLKAEFCGCGQRMMLYRLFVRSIIAVTTDQKKVAAERVLCFGCATMS